MCTILTVNSKFWKNNRKAVIAQIKSDAMSNSDGVAAVMLAGLRSKDLSLSGMHIDQLLPAITSWMDKGQPEDRLFLHQRMATTQYVGLPFNHGFTDYLGCIIMHNGILRSPTANRLAVDSYALATSPRGTDEAILALMEDKETYANVFRIYPQEHRYEMLRLSTGSLYTDGFGNYSSNRVGGVAIAVKPYMGENHVLEVRKTKAEFKPKPAYNSYAWNSYDNDDYSDYDSYTDRGWMGGSRGSRTTSNNIQTLKELGWEKDANGIWSQNKPTSTTIIEAVTETIEATSEEATSQSEDLSEDGARASERWEMAEGDDLLIENDYFFVIHNSDYLYVYNLSDGTMYKKQAVLVGELDWQASVLLDECSAGVRYAGSL